LYEGQGDRIIIDSIPLPLVQCGEKVFCHGLMTGAPNRELKNSAKNWRAALIVLAVCSLVVLLICGVLWRYWFGPRQMLVAIATEDSVKAQRLMHLGVSPNADVFLIGGLMNCAAARGRTQMMDIMYRAGADVNRIDGDGGTPAHDAVECKKLDSLKWLIAHGADSTRTNRYGFTVAQFVTNQIEEPQQEEFLSALKLKIGGANN